MPHGDANGLYSIGRAASVTGISSATLRVWERRYGRPVPVRLPSGHRRFTREQVRWLRRVAEALALGGRPGDVIAATEEELEKLVSCRSTGCRQELDRLLDLARAFRGPELAAALRRDIDALGARGVLLERVAPFIVEMGRAWADGRLDIRHEHHASIHIEDLLRQLRCDACVKPGAPTMLLSTLPGEPHGLGIHMAAALGTHEGVDVRVLGTETPLVEIVAAARETRAAAVGIGVSLATGGPRTDRVLAELRGMLADDVRLLVGGAGARGVRRGPRNIEYVESLCAFAEWLRGLRPAAAQA